MQGLVGVLCFALLIATGTCLECESCSGFKEDCTSQLELCKEGQDTCAIIRTETVMGKVSSFTIVKSCFQSSNCLSSSKGNYLIRVNVNIECSSSPDGMMESEDVKAKVFLNNELPDNQLQVEGFGRPKSRAAGRLKSNLFAAGDTPVEKTAAKAGATAAEPDATAAEPDATAAEPDATAAEPDATAANPDATAPKPDTTTAKPTTKPKTTTAKPKETTTVGNAHQTVASFFLALSSLLLMNILF